MKESYELIEVKGKDEEIEKVTIALHYKTDKALLTSFRSETLLASIDKNSDNDIIMHCALNAIGSGNLKKIRKDTQNKFSKLNELETYYDKKLVHIERVYVKLALIELNLWSSFKQYFESNLRTDKEKLFFDEAKYWNKYNPIIVSAFSHFDETVIDKVYELAFDLSLEENIRHIFA